MVWFLVDDNVTFHKKVMDAGNAAFGAWTRAGAWSAANLTNGFIPCRIAYRIAPGPVFGVGAERINDILNQAAINQERTDTDADD